MQLWSCPCDCKAKLKEEIILRWRLKYHTKIRGSSQQLKLLELYQETLTDKRKINNSTHVVEGEYICRFVIFSYFIVFNRLEIVT